MHYYLDGYNLIFRTLAAGETLQSRREQLILDLSTKIELLHLETTVIFDSQYKDNEATRHHYKNMEIYYTDQGETADDYIIKRVKQLPPKTKATVVTSDLHLAWRARREGAFTVSAEEYLSWLQRRFRNKAHQGKEPADGEKPTSTEAQLPKLLPLKESKKKKNLSVKLIHEFDFYMEQFGGVDNEGKKTKAPDTHRRLEPPSSHKQLKSQEPYESDFDRWLREFNK